MYGGDCAADDWFVKNEVGYSAPESPDAYNFMENTNLYDCLNFITNSYKDLKTGDSLENGETMKETFEASNTCPSSDNLKCSYDSSILCDSNANYDVTENKNTNCTAPSFLETSNVSDFGLNVPQKVDLFDDYERVKSSFDENIMHLNSTTPKHYD